MNQHRYVVHASNGRVLDAPHFHDRIYAGVEVCQIFYHTIEGDITEYESEKYQNNNDIQPSMMFKEVENANDPQMRLAFGQDKK